MGAGVCVSPPACVRGRERKSDQSSQVLLQHLKKNPVKPQQIQYEIFDATNGFICKSTTLNHLVEINWSRSKGILPSGNQQIFFFSQNAVVSARARTADELFTPSSVADKCFEVIGALRRFMSAMFVPFQRLREVPFIAFTPSTGTLARDGSLLQELSLKRST